MSSLPTVHSRAPSHHTTPPAREEAERAAAEEELRRVRRAQLMQLYAADHEREDAALRRRGLAYYTEVDGMQ